MLLRRCADGASVGCLPLRHHVQPQPTLEIYPAEAQATVGGELQQVRVPSEIQNCSSRDGRWQGRGGWGHACGQARCQSCFTPPAGCLECCAQGGRQHSMHSGDRRTASPLGVSSLDSMLTWRDSNWMGREKSCQLVSASEMWTAGSKQCAEGGGRGRCL